MTEPRTTTRVSLTTLLALALPLLVGGQQVPPSGPEAQLKLTVETATTDDDGNPTSLRVTVTNEGGSVVTMPVLSEGACSPDQRLLVRVVFIPDDPGHGRGGGVGCGDGSSRTLLERLKRNWVQLRPNESMTATMALQPAADEPGTVEYWVRYEPAHASVRELEEVWKSGYLIPTEPLESEHKSFHVQ